MNSYQPGSPEVCLERSELPPIYQGIAHEIHAPASALANKLARPKRKNSPDKVRRASCAG